MGGQGREWPTTSTTAARPARLSWPEPDDGGAVSVKPDLQLDEKRPEISPIRQPTLTVLGCVPDTWKTPAARGPKTSNIK